MVISSNDWRRITATGNATRGCVTQTPSTISKVSTPFGKLWLTITAISAFAVRWSSRNLVSHASLQFLVRLDSHRMVPLAWPPEPTTRCTTSPPYSPWARAR